MKITMFLFFLLFKHIFNYISIPFKNSKSLSLLQNISNPENIYDALINIDITIDINIGTPFQKIPISLSLNNPYIYITSNILSNGIFNNEKSSSYNEISEISLGDKNYYKNGYYCTDLFNFNNKNTELFFILTTKMEYSTETRKGLIGLSITDYKNNQTLMNQLKTKEIINNYYFFLNYKNFENGDMIFGGTPHEIFPKKYPYTEFRQVNTGGEFPSWEIKFSKFFYGDEIFDKIMKCSLDFSFGMLLVTNSVRLSYYSDFFEKRIENNFCEEIKYNDYFIYSCIDDDNKVHFNELKDFHFINTDLEFDFVFNYNDLFVSFNNKKYFLITSQISSLEFRFGKPFFKKYTIVFNSDNKQIGNYIKVLNEEEKENWFKRNIIALIIIICLLIILIGIGIFFGGKLFKKKKKRINEVDDNFDYQSGDKIIDE